MKAIIPNGLTSLNLVFGMCSIISTLSGSFTAASVCILLALVADGMDGRAARALGVSSELGKELDSLSDLVSFGAAPAIMVYQLYLHTFGMAGGAVSVLFALCGAIRLARFNVNASTVHGYFVGLAIPAGGCLLASSTLFLTSIGYDYSVLGWGFPVIVAVIGLLMVSTVHYPDFKGSGEKIHIVAKIIFVLMFAGIVAFGSDSLLYAIIFALFSSYAFLGIANTIISMLSGRSGR